ncbi:hypothetical protein [Nguyenibacter sp. L1]|uniref:hypothetical protein n=1 Tax=Nguyenibacter sp. L1 TaxID=3049350 RepID=UPI002B48012C|nr:hypothetical protein [Nguyenibacter sp. L1]WRH89232.1 hypothetical protein QN315_06390 [Nguyenibacter sp. L1]
MPEKFLKVIEYINGANAYVIWSDLNPGVTKNVNSAASVKELLDFFEFSISNNIIIEFDTEKNTPVFSCDSPKVVAQRIFRDFSSKVPHMPEFDPPSDDDFVGYLMFKRGWAVLVHGTRLMLPD